jgi:Tfp pilus assembly protein PilN
MMGISSNLVLLAVVGGMAIGAFLYIRKLFIDANMAKELIEKNKQLQERHAKLDKLEEDKDAILEELRDVKSNSNSYKRILSDLKNRWPGTD